MSIIDNFTERAVENITKEILFNSYDTILKSIQENNSDKNYTPIYSYDRDEESERLNKIKESFEDVMEWCIGSMWILHFKVYDVGL